MPAACWRRRSWGWLRSCGTPARPAPALFSGSPGHAAGPPDAADARARWRPSVPPDVLLPRRDGRLGDSLAGRLPGAGEPRPAGRDAGGPGPLVLAPAAWQLIRVHPFELSYYNELIGGPRGAWRRGFELAYWYDAFNDQTLAEMNDPKTGLPPGPWSTCSTSGPRRCRRSRSCSRSAHCEPTCSGRAIRTRFLTSGS